MSATEKMKAAARSRIQGCGWDLPMIKAVLPPLDLADAAVRRCRGLNSLPRFSMRIRSNGLEGQFGGVRFAHYGRVIAGDLVLYAGLNADSAVLDMGCGVGRVAHALVQHFPKLDYTGIDIDRTQIDEASRTPALAGFRFLHADVQNDLYNDAGGSSAATYRLPLADDSVDVIYLVSVFTHMWSQDCRGYVAEFLRTLRPGGHCAVTTHLLPEGPPPEGWEQVGDTFCRYPQVPLKMVGHTVEQLAGFFGREPEAVIHGTWRRPGSVLAPGAKTHDFNQDMVVFKA